MAGVMLSKINFNESNNHGIAIGVVSNLAKFIIPIVKLCCVHTFEGNRFVFVTGFTFNLHTNNSL